MRWDDIGSLPCSIARTLSVVGDRWALLILRDAFLGARRFEEFHASLELSRHRLAARLRKLCDEGVFERRRYREHPPRYEYRLTEKGRDLYPVIAALLRWGDRWMAEGAPPVEVVHRRCGKPLTLVLTCPACGDEVTARDVRVTGFDTEKRLA